MRKIIILSLVVMLFVIGCARDLPPEPGAPGAPIGKATGVFAGYAPTIDVFNEEKIFSLEVAQEDKIVMIKADVNHVGGYVYKYGYINTKDGWKKYEFPQDTVGRSNWIRKSANMKIQKDVDDLNEGDNYILGFSCKKYKGAWKCGCREENDCGYWMIHVFQVEKKPDLTVSSISFEEVVLNNKLGIQAYVTIENIGNKEALSPVILPIVNGEKLPYTIFEENLPVGEAFKDTSPELFFDFDTFSGKDVELEFIVDPDNTITETFEHNNKLLTIATISEELPEQEPVTPGEEQCDIKAVLKEGDTKTFTANTWDYDVTAIVITDSPVEYAQFKINGEVTEKLVIGQSGKLADEAEIKVLDVLVDPNSTDMVEFCLNGAPAEETIACEDSDGADYFEQGKTTLGEAYIDYCSGSTLWEYSCGRGIGKNQYFIVNTPEGDALLKYDYITTCDVEKRTANFKVIDIGDMAVGQNIELVIDENGLFTMKLVGKEFNFKAYGCEANPEIDLADEFITKEKFVCPMGCDAGVCLTGPQGNDYVKFNTEENMLEFGESLYSVVPDVGSEFSLLGDGKLTNDIGTFGYTQEIHTPESAHVVFETSLDHSDDPALYLKFPDEAGVYAYTIRFDPKLVSRVKDGELIDLVGNKLNLLGKEYEFIQAIKQADRVVLDLMGGELLSELYEGQSATFTVADKDYLVENIVVSDTYVQFKVNGEVTDKVTRGSTYKLADGLEIGVLEIVTEVDEEDGTQIDYAQFYLGAKKISFNDFLADSKGTYTVGGTEVSDIIVDIEGYGTETDVTIKKISLAWYAPGVMYVPQFEKLSAELMADEKEKLFLQGIDFQFVHADDEYLESIQFVPSSTNKYKLKMQTRTGGLLNDAVYYSDNNSEIHLGYSDTKKLHVADGDVASKNDFFVTEANGFSHLLQVVSFDPTNEKVKIKDVGLGTTFEVTAKHQWATAYYIDGYEFQLMPDYNKNTITLTVIAVDAGDHIADLWSEYGARVALLSKGIALVSERKEDGTRDTIDATLKAENGILTIDTVYGVNLIALDSDIYTKKGVSDYGVNVKLYDKEAQNLLSISYPDRPTNPLVALVKAECSFGYSVDEEGKQLMFNCP